MNPWIAFGGAMLALLVAGFGVVQAWRERRHHR